MTALTPAVWAVFRLFQSQFCDLTKTRDLYKQAGIFATTSFSYLFFWLFVSIRKICKVHKWWSIMHFRTSVMFFFESYLCWTDLPSLFLIFRQSLSSLTSSQDDLIFKEIHGRRRHKQLDTCRRHLFKWVLVLVLLVLLVLMSRFWFCMPLQSSVAIEQNFGLSEVDSKVTKEKFKRSYIACFWCHCMDIGTV